MSRPEQKKEKAMKAKPSLDDKVFTLDLQNKIYEVPLREVAREAADKKYRHNEARLHWPAHMEPEEADAAGLMWSDYCEALRYAEAERNQARADHWDAGDQLAEPLEITSQRLWVVYDDEDVDSMHPTEADAKERYDELLLFYIELIEAMKDDPVAWFRSREEAEAEQAERLAD